jgi:hypothetical protein
VEPSVCTRGGAVLVYRLQRCRRASANELNQCGSAQVYCDPSTDVHMPVYKPFNKVTLNTTTAQNSPVALGLKDGQTDTLARLSGGLGLKGP